MSDEESVERLAQEKARWELKRELAKLRQETNAYGVPWWRRATIVTAIATLMGAALPATTAINSKLQSDKELALKSLEQQHAATLASLRFTEDVRSRYLDRMKDEAERQRTLRFLIATATDEGIRKWAQAEMVLVDSEVARVKKRITELEEQRAQAVAEFRAALSKRQAEAASLGQQVQRITQEKTRLESQLKSTSPHDDLGVVTRRNVTGEDPCVSTCMAKKSHTADSLAYIKYLEECREVCDLQ